MLYLAVYTVKARLGKGLINSHWGLYLCAWIDQPSISVYNTFHTNRTVTGHFITVTHQPHCNNLPPFTEPEGKGQMELLHIKRPYSLKVYFNIKFLCTLRYYSFCLSLLGFLAICLYSLLFASIRIFSLPNNISEEWKVWSTSISTFLFSVSNYPLRTLLSSTHWRDFSFKLKCTVHVNTK